VVVEEGDPLRRRGPPPDVAGGRRTAAARAEDVDGDAARGYVERLGAVERAVGDEDDPRGCRAVLAEHVGEHVAERGAPDGRQDDGVVAHATATGASSSTARAASAASDVAKSWARWTRCGPRTRRSTGADPKSSSASRGSSTIGRPAVLRLVLMTTGRPVRSANAVIVAPRRGWRAGSTVWMRAVPSTWTAAGMRSRHSGRTVWTKSMYGLGIGPSAKISSARSASTIGATGRNCSRPLTSLRRSRFSSRP